MRHSSIQRDTIRQILREKSTLIALGVCGVGMRALASLLCDLGHTVIGYDRTLPDASLDGRIRFHSDPSTLPLSDASLVVYTLAMGDEWEEALSGIPHASRAQVLGALMSDFPHSIAVAGSHGKSTVTALLGHILAESSRAPTVVSGASLFATSTPYRSGDGSLLLLEACEYRRSFTYFSPSVYLLLNLELDHTDCYETLENLRDAFVDAARTAERIFWNCDDENLKIVKNSLQNDAISFGESEESDYRAVFLPPENGVHSFRFFARGRELCTVTPRLLGWHGARNTLAALAVALEEGIDLSCALRAIETFGGIPRRLELLGHLGAHPVYYDYAHHPSEIEATLRTLSQRWGRDATVIFRPHTFTRTRDLWEGFAQSLRLGRLALLCPIFPARESPIEGITSDALAAAIGSGARVLASPSELFPLLAEDEPVVLLGAGDLDDLLSVVTSAENFLGATSAPFLHT